MEGLYRAKAASEERKVKASVELPAEAGTPAEAEIRGRPDQLAIHQQVCRKHLMAEMLVMVAPQARPMLAAAVALAETEVKAAERAHVPAQ